MALARDGRARSVHRSLTLAFLGVVASFLAATAWSQCRVAGIDEPATEIATNAAPSIEKLAAARADLSELQVHVFTALRELEDGKRFDPAPIEMYAQRLRDDIRAYLAQPAFAGEQAFASRILTASNELEIAQVHVEAQARTGNAAAARLVAANELRAAVSATGQAIDETTSFNARSAADLALMIETRRQRSTRITFALNVICALAAIVAALVVRRAHRAHQDLLESRNALLERRADELDAFASRVAHDLLNPLGTIRFGLELIALRIENRALESLVHRSIAGVDRAGAVVRDLLAFARAAAAPESLGRASLREAVDEVLEEVSREADQADVTLVRDEIPDCDVACAPGVLTSILSNLMRNAVKYMNGQERRQVGVRGKMEHGRVIIEVSDTGPGIPRPALDLIFLPHVRGATGGQPGLGLGLATVKRLVEAHGGAVHVRSTVGEGSVFAVEMRTC